MLNIAGFGSNLFGVVSGIKTGKQMQRIMEEIKNTDAKIEHLSEDIKLIESIVIKSRNQSEQKRLQDKYEIKQILEPLQKAINQKIITSTVIPAPQKAKKVLKDPSSVLIDISRLNNIAPNKKNNNLVPIVFRDQSSHYLGWQSKGVIPLVFDLDYRPELWSKPIELVSLQNKTARILSGTTSVSAKYMQTKPFLLDISGVLNQVVLFEGATQNGNSFNISGMMSYHSFYILRGQKIILNTSGVGNVVKIQRSISNQIANHDNSGIGNIVNIL